jgi:hypothetical protein
MPSARRFTSFEVSRFTHFLDNRLDEFGNSRQWSAVVFGYVLRFQVGLAFDSHGLIV